MVNDNYCLAAGQEQSAMSGQLKPKKRIVSKGEYANSVLSIAM